MDFNDTSKFGYDYLQDVCRAITQYTDDVVKSDPNSFYYHGANLRFAFERYLYFSCIGNNLLYMYYSKAKKNIKQEKIKLAEEIPITLIRYIHKNFEKAEVKKIKNLRFFVKKLKVKKILENIFDLFFLKKINNNDKFPKIIFYINSIKFARYLEPIIEKIDQTFAFLVLSHKDENISLCGSKYPILDFTRHKKQPIYSIKTKGKFISSNPLLTESFNRIYFGLDTARPSVVVVVEGNAPTDILVNEACKLLSIPVICIQQGWSPIVHNGFRNMSFTKMLVWGDGFSNILRPYNKNQKFLSVGNHIIEKIEQRSIQTILNLNAISFFLQRPTLLISEKSFEDILNLIFWTADKYIHTNILVREHPSYPLPKNIIENLKRRKNITIASPNIFNLDEVLLASKISVAVFSSTILESIAVGTLPIICNLDSLPKYFPDVDYLGAGIEVKKIIEAKITIDRALNDNNYFLEYKKGMDNFRSKFFNNGNAAEMIVNQINSY